MTSKMRFRRFFVAAATVAIGTLHGTCQTTIHDAFVQTPQLLLGQLFSSATFDFDAIFADLMGTPTQ